MKRLRTAGADEKTRNFSKSASLDMTDAGPIIEPAKVESGDQFLLKMVATTNQRLSFPISSAKTQSARFRLTPRSMLATSRVRMRRPCVLRPS